MSIEEQKKQLRKAMFAIRNGIDPMFKQEYDQRVCQKIEKRIRTNDIVNPEWI